MASNLYIGIMSGSSLDGIDVAICDFSKTTAGAPCQTLATHFLAYPSALKQQLLQLHTPHENELETSAVIGNTLATLYAQAVNTLLAKQSLNAHDIIAIGNHGQTIRHRPERGFTLQIGNAALLAELTGIAIVTDFRSRDIAAGGQGAPLVPAFHQAMFADKFTHRAIVNIGGIANITYLAKNSADISAAKISGFDSGPGNMLLDSWINQHLGKDYDADGAWAATGQVLPALLTQMLAEPYFAMHPPKSTGRDLFSQSWLAKLLANQDYRPQDVAATLLMLSARTICDALAQHCGDVEQVFLCGGGAHNGLLLQYLGEMLSNIKLSTTDELGVGVDWVEAVAFAWLAKQAIEAKPGNLPAVTGAKGLRILGAIYPA